MRRLGVLVAPSAFAALFWGALACAEPAMSLGTPVSARGPVAQRSESTLGGGASSAAAVRPLWTFHAGAPLRAPAGVAKTGIAVGTSDGYLHVLRADGAYRWSYTVKGAIVSAPLLDEQGAVYVATSASKLHAFHPQGKLTWTASLVGKPLGGMRFGLRGELLLTTSAGMAYAFGRSGNVKVAASLRQTPSTGPLLLDDGSWVVGTEKGSVFKVEGFRARPQKVADSRVLGLVAAGSGFVGLSEERLFGTTSADEGPFAALGCDGDQTAVVAKDGRVGRVSGGKLRWFAKTPELPSAAPACLRDGRVLLPAATGDLVVIASDGGVRRVALGAAELFAPVVDEPNARIIVSAIDGRTVALPSGAL